jgi:hypothetical protein
MKKLLPFVFAIMAMLSHSFAQVRVQMKSSNSSSAKDLTREDIERLKKTTTIFAYCDRDKDRLDELESAFDQVWKITKYKIVSFKELDAYLDKPNYSYLTFSGVGVGSAIFQLGLNLWIPVAGKKGKSDMDSYSEIELFPAIESIYSTPAGDGAMESLYTKAVFNNWSPGYLKYYLKLVSDDLMKGESRSLNRNTGDPEKLAALKTKTLYIPDYVFRRLNTLTGKEEKKYDVDDLLGKYPYKYKVVSNDELNEMILTPSEPVYYIVYGRSATDKYMSVFSTTDGLIYTQYKHGPYSIIDNDFKDIVKAMNSE